MQNKKSKNTKAPLKREIPANTIGRELDEFQFAQAIGDVVPFKKSHEKGKVEKTLDIGHDEYVIIEELEKEKRLAEINKELAAARRDAPVPQDAFGGAYAESSKLSSSFAEASTSTDQLSSFTEKGWIRTSALPENVAELRRKDGAARQRRYFAKIAAENPEKAAENLKKKSDRQRQRRAEKRAAKPS